MRDKLRYTEYQKLYKRNKTWRCPLCNIDMGINSKYRHLKSDKHLIIEETIIGSGGILPTMVRKKQDTDWKCPVCKDRFVYKNKTAHVRSFNHLTNVKLLEEKGEILPRIFFNEKMNLTTS